jgi:hypothetical protein
VIERLASIETRNRSVPPIPPAIPDADPDRPVRTLRVRLGEEGLL